MHQCYFKLTLPVLFFLLPSPFPLFLTTFLFSPHPFFLTTVLSFPLSLSPLYMQSFLSSRILQNIETKWLTLLFRTRKAQASMSDGRFYPVSSCRYFLPSFNVNASILPRHTLQSLPSNLGITAFARLPQFNTTKVVFQEVIKNQCG